MKKLGKITSLIVGLVLLLAVPSFALDKTINIENHSFYLSYTGIVSEIEKVNENLTRVYLENEDGSIANFILNENTYYADNVKIEKGSSITGYYEAGKPMILIYPPQYTIDIVTPVYEKGFVKADKFDSNLLSMDKQLKINISDDTEIIWENNTEINWFVKPSIKDLETVLSNRTLIVYYDVTTRSIPAQTTPSKVIVLSQQFEDVENLESTNLIKLSKLMFAPLTFFIEALNASIELHSPLAE